MITYEKAEEKFNATKKPPRSKKYADNQRPLRRVPESHLMLQKDAESYVYKINGAEVVRLFKPEPDGSREVAIRGLYATFDIHLMHKFTGLFSCKPFETTDGAIVRVPLNPYYSNHGNDFSAVLVFDNSLKLIREKSWHTPVFVMRSTADDKAQRKNLKEQLDAFITLQMFKLPTLKAECTPSLRQGQAFGEDGLTNSLRSSMQTVLQNKELPTQSESFMSSFNEVAQAVFNGLVSKKLHNAHGSKPFYKPWNADPTWVDDAREMKQDMAESVTPDEFKVSLVGRLLTLADIKQGSDKSPLPQFAETLPRKFLY